MKIKNGILYIGKLAIYTRIDGFIWKIGIAIDWEWNELYFSFISFHIHLNWSEFTKKK